MSPRGSLERLIAERAASQHGVVSLGQLVDQGLSARAVRDRVSYGRLHRIHAGVYAHTSSTLLPRDVEKVDGIPCTTVARTLDLGAVLPRRVVERAFNQAEVLRVLDMRQVDDVLSRAGGHRGAAILRAIIADYTGPTITRNDLEEALLAICRTAGLPQTRGQRVDRA